MGQVWFRSEFNVQSLTSKETFTSDVVSLVGVLVA